MHRSEKEEKKEKEYESPIVAAWGGGDKQKRWSEWKEDTINLVEEMFLKENATFEDIYRFTAKSRKNIAEELDQDEKYAL